MTTYNTSVGVQTLCNTAIFFVIVGGTGVVLLLMLRNIKLLLGGCVTIIAAGLASLVCGGGTSLMFGGASGVLMGLIIGGLTIALIIPFLRWINWLKPYHHHYN